MTKPKEHEEQEVRILQPASPGLQLYGEDVTRRALMLVKTRNLEAHTLLNKRRAFMLNVYDIHLPHIDEAIQAHAQGGQNELIFRASWLHPLAEEVVTLVFRIPDGKDIEEVARELTGHRM